MKAAVLKSFGSPLVLEQNAPEPACGADDVLIRVATCGIDGTDLKLLDGFGYTPQLPFIMGHEPAGTIEKTGSNVLGFQTGDRVIAYVFFYCGECENCRSGHENRCLDMKGVLGVKDHHGGYAELVRVPARQVVKIPDTLAFEDASVLCDAGLTAYHGVERAGLAPGENVLIFGVGGVGSFAVQFARLAGANCIAVDTTPQKLDQARKMGAHHALLMEDGKNLKEEILKITGGKGVDKVIDIVGAEKTIAHGIDCLKTGGRMVIVGYTPDRFPLEGKVIAQRELEIIGSRCGSYSQLSELAQLAASGKIKSIVTDRAPFSSVNAALQKLQNREVMGRMVLHWEP